MKQVKQLIVEGHGQAACERFGALLGQYPEKMKPAIELLLKVLQDCYHEGHTAALQGFLTAAAALPGEAAGPIRKLLEPRLERIGHWIETLDGVTRERLARECRRHVVLKELKAAAVSGARLLERARDAAELDRNARFLAHALSDLRHDRERAAQAVALIPSAGRKIAPNAGQMLAAHFAEAVRLLADRGFDQGEQAWTRMLTDAILQVSERLPGGNEVGDPTAEQLQTFGDEVQAILGAGLAKGRKDDWIDALQVLVDFCPIDEMAIKSVAGVEERIFLRLGPRARLTAVRSVRQAGSRENVRRAVLQLAHSEESRGRLKLLAGIIGGMGHRDFFDVLHKMLPACKGKLEEAWVVDALSRNEHPKAARVLLDRLTGVVRHLGRHEGLARADELLKAVARLTRQRDFDIALRNKVIQRVVELTEGSDRILTALAAERLFSNRPEEIDPELRNWAVRKSVEAMWSQPLSSPAGAPASANGWRQPMVAALVRQGNAMLPEILEAAESYKSRYSGALGALGNVLEAIGDERAVPLLDCMIHCAMTHVENPRRSHLLDEKVRDAATGELHELDRDELTHGLLHSMLACGGEPARRVALDYADQAQAGRIQPPGDKTAALLFDMKLKEGNLNEASQTAEIVILDEKALKGLLAEARGGLFARPGKRIAAMAALGQIRDPEGVGVLVEGLGDKDALVAGAAHTALGQYMHPLPAEGPFCAFWIAALDKPKLLKGPLRDRLMEFIRREMPKNPPYDKLFERQVAAMVEDEELAHRLRGAARKADTESKSQNAGEAGAERQSPRANAEEVSELDRKRSYMQARRAWIQGGKKGPAPEPPA